VLERIEEPVDLLGHSFGAICCLEAARLANNVRRLVLYEPPVPVGVDFVSRELVRRIEALVERHAREEALVLFFREVVRVPPDQLATMRSLDAWKARVAGAHTLPREMQVDRVWHFEAEQFRTLQTPTLLLLGGESPPIFRQATELVDASLPDSRIVILEGQQHVAMDTAPALFVGEVLRFLHASA
jgi:pimeloyl-ACP methyl ester carboxylesterase